MNRRLCGLLFAAVLVSGSASHASANEVIELESTIVGSQEQPKVLYIIPWKPAGGTERLEGGLPQTLTDIFSHRDYTEFRRELELLRADQKSANDTGNAE